MIEYQKLKELLWYQPDPGKYRGIAMAQNNQPLTINVHVIDIDSDKEIDSKQFQISKINVDLRKHRNYSSAKDDHDKQETALNSKYARIMNLVIWAMNNKKELHFISSEDDE